MRALFMQSIKKCIDRIIKTIISCSPTFKWWLLRTSIQENHIQTVQYSSHSSVLYTHGSFTGATTSQIYRKKK